MFAKNLNNKQLSCSVGVIVYNEADNIIPLLKALTEQQLTKVKLEEIIIVSSACTDGTDELVTDYARSHPHVRLIQQAERKGKSSAINLFLKEARSGILMIESGDTIPAPLTLEKLIAPFADEQIGATGGRPMPVNDEKTFMGYIVHLLWRLHHRMSLLQPKLGEVIAFRKLFDSIPEDSAVDEASIEALILQNNLQLKYIPDAIIFNKGPENLRDFIKQRRRIQNGHLWLKNRYRHKVSSQQQGILWKIMVEEIRSAPARVVKLAVVMAIEMYCRLLGDIDYYLRKKNPFVWTIATSTKKLDKDS